MLRESLYRQWVAVESLWNQHPNLMTVPPGHMLKCIQGDGSDYWKVYDPLSGQTGFVPRTYVVHIDRSICFETPTSPEMLFRAIEISDARAVVDYLRRGISPDHPVLRLVNGALIKQYPLHLSVQKNSFELVEILLTAGANANLIGDYGQTALHLACKNDLQTMALLLLSFGASPAILNKERDHCIRLSQPNMVKYLKVFEGIRTLVLLANKQQEKLFHALCFNEICTIINHLSIFEKRAVLRSPGLVAFLLECLSPKPGASHLDHTFSHIGRSYPNFPLSKESIPTSDTIPPDSIKMEAHISQSVHRALYHHSLVAAKVLNGAIDFREATLLSILLPFDHPTIIKFHGLSLIDRNIPTLIMELCDNSLEHLLIQSPSWFSRSNCFEVGRRVLNALIFLSHTFLDDSMKHILLVHRDLKLGNVLLRQRCDPTSAVLADFGISRTVGLTITKCTITHAPPEYLFHRKDLGPNLRPFYDIWSFACIMWEMLSSTLIHSLFPTNESMKSHLLSCYPSGEVDDRSLFHMVPFKRPPTSICSAEEWDLICCCWHKKPELRPDFLTIYRCLYKASPCVDAMLWKTSRPESNKFAAMVRASGTSTETNYLRLCPLGFLSAFGTPSCILGGTITIEVFYDSQAYLRILVGLENFLVEEIEADILSVPNLKFLLKYATYLNNFVACLLKFLPNYSFNLFLPLSFVNSPSNWIRIFFPPNIDQGENLGSFKDILAPESSTPLRFKGPPNLARPSNFSRIDPQTYTFQSSSLG